MWEIAPIEETREISFRDATGNNFLPPPAPLTPLPQNKNKNSSFGRNYEWAFEILALSSSLS